MTTPTEAAPRLSSLLAGVVLAGSVAALALPEAIGHEPAPAKAGETISGYVESVVDGDSLKISPPGTFYPRGVGAAGVPVRLFGIDAMELHQTCEPASWRCGHAAWGALYEMVRDDRNVTCEVRDRDRYGRIVAICRNKLGDLGRRLVARGWALDYARYSGGRYRDEEAAAKAEGLGIWRGTFVRPEEWRKERRP